MSQPLVLAWVPVHVARAQGYKIHQLSPTNDKVVPSLERSDADVQVIAERIYQTGDDELDHIFDRLRRSNEPPSAPEVLKLHAFHASCITDMKNIYNEADLVQKSVADLAQRLAESRDRCIQTQMYIKICTDFLSPVRSLPEDILEEIFIQCLFTWGRRAGCRTAPLQLCHVCSQWRQVTLRLPQLWDELELIVGPEPDPSSPNRHNAIQRVVKLMNMWLLGSKHLPISLSFSISQTSPPSELTKKLKDALIPHINRIRKLGVRSSSMNDLQSFCIFPGIHFQILECLTLDIDDKVDDDADMPVKLFELAPLLRKVEIGITYKYNPSPPPFQLSLLPWGQLTDLDIFFAELDIMTWRRIFEECAVLQSGSFTVGEFNHNENEDMFLHFDELVDFPCLLSLQVRFAGRGNVSCIYGYTFPSLTRFQLIVDEEEFIWVPPPHSLQLFSLRTFILTEGALSAQDLIDFLAAVPSVTNMTIDIDLDYDSIMEHLTYIGEDEPLLPNLEMLNMNALVETSFSHDTDPEFSPEKLANMVYSRWWPDSVCVSERPVCRLSQLFLTFDAPEDEVEKLKGVEDLHGIRPLLRDCISQGLKFDMRVVGSRYDVCTAFL